MRRILTGAVPLALAATSVAAQGPSGAPNCVDVAIVSSSLKAPPPGQPKDPLVVKYEQVGSELGISFENWLIGECVTSPSKPVLTLEQEARAAVALWSRNDIDAARAAGRAYVQHLRSAWPAIYRNPQLVHPAIGPQAAFDVINLATQIEQLLSIDSSASSPNLFPGIRQAAPRASLEDGVELYTRWAKPTLLKWMREGQRAARSGTPPYETIRNMLRVDKNLALMGNPDRSWLDEVRGILEIAWNSGGKRISCEPTRAEYQRVLRFSRDLSMLGSHVADGSLSRVGVTFFRAEGRRNPAERPQLARAALQLGFKGLAHELQTGRLTDDPVELLVAPDQGTVPKNGSTRVTVYAYGCKKRPLENRDIDLLVLDLAGAEISPDKVTTDSRGTASAQFKAPDDTGSVRLVAQLWYQDPVSGERKLLPACSVLTIERCELPTIRVGDDVAKGTIVATYNAASSTHFYCWLAATSHHGSAIIRRGATGKEPSALVQTETTIERNYDSSEPGCERPPPCGVSKSERWHASRTVPALLVVSPHEGGYVITFSVSSFPIEMSFSGKSMGLDGRCVDTPPRTDPDGVVFPYSFKSWETKSLIGSVSETHEDGGVLTVRWNLTP